MFNRISRTAGGSLLAVGLASSEAGPGEAGHGWETKPDLGERER